MNLDRLRRMYKRLKQAKNSLSRAEVRPNVTQQELEALHSKIDRIYAEIDREMNDETD